MPRGRWMLRIIRKTRRRMRVYVEVHERGSGWFKGKEESVVRLYREDVGIFVFKVRRKETSSS